MPGKAWKLLELQVAKFFGTDRVPLSGAMRSLKTRSDSLHDVLFIEAKYRSDNSLVRRFYALQDTVLKPVVVAIRKTNQRGYLLLFHCDTLEQVANSFDPRSDKQLHCEYWVTMRSSQYDLYTDTAEKAVIENKVPVVALREKWKKEKGTRPRKGFLLLANPKHLQTLYNEYRTAQPE